MYERESEDSEALNQPMTSEHPIEELPVARENRIIVVIPAYNEERFIGSVVLKSRRYVDTVIVVDDGSQDATAEIARAAGAVVVSHEQNAGKGVALNTGFAQARELAPDVVVTIDGDWQHMPEQIQQVAAPVLQGDADIVVGSRYLERNSAVPLTRVVGHWGFTTMTNILSGISLTDSQSGYRAFSARALQVLNFSSRSFSVESEMQFLANHEKLQVLEVPITIRYEDRPKRNVVKHGFNVLDGILNLVVIHRPLFFFGLIGGFFLLISLVATARFIQIFRVYEQIAVGTALIVVTFLILAVFSVFTGIILWAMRIVLENIRTSVGIEQLRR